MEEEYGLASFVCGDEGASNELGDCDNLGGDSVLSLRYVRFEAGFHESAGVSELLLDFVVRFSSRAGGQYAYASSQLINAYTLSQPTPTNIEFEFLNLFLASGQTNHGMRIPSLLSLECYRDEGEHVLVFFDSFIDNSHFDEDGTVGCSQGRCQYFAGDKGTLKDNHLLQAGIVFRKEFGEVLAPVLLKASADNRPRHLVVATASESLLATRLGSARQFRLHKSL